MLFMGLSFAWVKGSNRVLDAIHYTATFTIPIPARTLRAPARLKSEISWNQASHQP